MLDRITQIVKAVTDTRTPDSLNITATWLINRADRLDRRGYVKSAQQDREKADRLYMQSYYLRKYGMVNPWAHA